MPPPPRVPQLRTPLNHSAFSASSRGFAVCYPQVLYTLPYSSRRSLPLRTSTHRYANSPSQLARRFSLTLVVARRDQHTTCCRSGAPCGGIMPGEAAVMHQAVEMALAGNWDGSHRTVQDYNSTTACWIHAVLHKIEGDAWNSRYWYARVPGHEYEDYKDPTQELKAIQGSLASQ